MAEDTTLPDAKTAEQTTKVSGTVQGDKLPDQKAAENKGATANPTPKGKASKPTAASQKKRTDRNTGGRNDAPVSDGKAANAREAEISASGERLGDSGPERGGVQAIEFERARAEKEEREGVVEYTPATYKDSKASHLLREIAADLGLTRPEDYAELSRLNGVDLNARIDAGEEVRLPSQYSYVDVENVTGGSVKK